MESELSELRAASEDAAFWSDTQRATKIMRRMSALEADVMGWRQLADRIADALELADLSEADDAEMSSALATEVEALEAMAEKREGDLLMAGEYAEHDALLSIHAGEGGTESQDWAAILQRMFIRWAERRGFRWEVLDTTPGEEAGIKSVHLQIQGRHAYGLLRSERGSHRLVRISPFDSSSRRHTSFAKVEVSPSIDDDVEVDMREEDIRVDVYRASGAGGQHVNKTSSAVRMTHLPTNTVVSCQNERSQAQNRESCMRLLRARLLELQIEEQEAQRARLKGENVEAGFGGNRIRSYVLHPYQQITDHRTGVEVGNVDAVLDGDIDVFIDAWLRMQVGADTTAEPA